MAYILQCIMQYGASVNHRVEIAQKSVHVYNLQENSETYLNQNYRFSDTGTYIPSPTWDKNILSL
jgi:hypothetical protein